MSKKRVAVTCEACDLNRTFDGLGAARSFIEDHRTETSHEADWELPRLAAGVERAGDEAGVCGRPGCTDTESPLYQGE